jgi:hypothetical protein
MDWWPVTAEDRLWELLAGATVRIQDGDGKAVGSGAFIEPRCVLTAAHVVVEAKPPLALTLATGGRCGIVNIKTALPRQRPPGHNVWPLPDLALLSVDDEGLDPSTPFVELTHDTPSRELLVSGAALGLSGDIVDDRARLQYESTIRDNGVALHKLSGNPIAPGMSGGPVLDPATGRVVGLVKADRGANDGAFAIAGAAIRDALPAEWAAHLEAHKRNGRWRREARKSQYARADSASLSCYLETLTTAYRDSPMLPEGVQRREVRQPARVRPRRAIGTEIAVDHAAVTDLQSASHAGETFLWDPHRSPWTSVAIVAGPGMGKTWLLTHHVASIAELGLDRVRENADSHDDVRVPVFVNASAFARRLESDLDHDQVVGALSGTIKRAVPTAPDRDAMAAMLGLALDDARLILCVDGLDEVPSDLRERLRAALAMLEPKLAQLVVSSRESARVALERVFAGEYEEFELTGFAPGDIRRFVRAWHGPRPDLIAKVERALHENAGLRTLARVPLLLNFVCQLAGADAPLASTRSRLYQQVAQNVLSGRWRAPEPEPTDSGVRLRLLSAAVGPLGALWRRKPDEFSRHEVELALRREPSYDAVRDAAEERWRAAQGQIDRGSGPPPTSPVIWEFLHDGFLVESQGPQGERLLRFTHLVFGELCVAMWLADLPPDGQAKQVALHRWFDGQWNDIIQIASGVATHPTRILDAIEIVASDPWLAQAELLAKCMVEAPHAASREAVSQLVEVLVGRLNAGPVSDNAAAQRALGALLKGHVDHADARLVAALRNREIARQEHKSFVMRLLCEIGEPYAIARCRETVANRAVSDAERDAAAVALCRSGDRDGVDLVVTTFTTERGTHRRLAVALATGERASQAALALVRRRDVDQAVRTTVAIEQLQTNGNDEAAVEMLDEPAIGLATRSALVVALLRAARPIDTELARGLIDNPNVTQTDRLELVHALLLRGEFSALPAAADIVIDLNVDYRRRRALAQTMVSVGQEGMQALYLSATLQSASPAARLQALRVLIERRHPDGCRAATMILAEGQGEPWLHAQVLRELLVHVPHLADRDLVMRMLSDPVFTDGRLRGAWEALAAEALRTADHDLRESIRSKIRDRVRVDYSKARELTAIDLERLLTFLGGAGPLAIDLLVDVASDGEIPMDTRINAAMTAVTSDVATVNRLTGPLLDDPALPPAVRDRLAVAFAMLGAPEMLPRVTALLPKSEPAYVAIRNVLRGETISFDQMQTGVRAAREAARTLGHGVTPSWDLDFKSLASEVDFVASSETERELRLAWVASELRRRTYNRLLSLLLPAERLALHRVDEFTDSEATRNWLAAWIPAYREIATTEAARLQALISSDPTILPDLDRGGPFKVVANIATLLDEWSAHLAARRWQSCLSLMGTYATLFASPIALDVDEIAERLAPHWPTNAARSYMLAVAQDEDDGLRQVAQLLLAHTGPLDAARAHFSAGDIGSAFGAASFAVLRNPDDAAGFFYAAEALAVADQPDQARELMRESAKRASGRQASQGRRSLVELSTQHNLSGGLIEELREILRSALADREEDLDDDTPVHMDPDHVEPDDKIVGEAPDAEVPNDADPGPNDNNNV